MNLQLERISGLANELKLVSIDDNATELTQQAAKEEWDYLSFLEKVLTAELDTRAVRRQSMYTPIIQDMHFIIVIFVHAIRILLQIFEF